MEKITNKKFIEYFEKGFRKIDELYEEHSCLEKLKRKHSNAKMTTKEMHDVGSVVLNIESGLELYLDLTVYKFIDLFNGIISSININSYSSAIVLSRGLYEHFAMFILKKTEFNKFLINKDYLRLSKDLIYWSTHHQNKDMAVGYKRTHIMDAIRYLKKYYADDWKKWPNQSENFYEEQYFELSELTHPASNSLLMYISEYKEKMSSEGFSAKITYSKNVEKQYLYNIAWILNITSNFLVSDLYPGYIDNVINKFDEMKEYTLKFFSLNPSHAKEILDNTVDKEVSDKKREQQGLDDIDKMRFDYFHKKKN